jgi:hypothetical protein
MGEEIISWFTPELLVVMLDVHFALSILDEPRDSVAYDTLEAALHAANETLMGQPSQ